MSFHPSHPKAERGRSEKREIFLRSFMGISLIGIRLKGRHSSWLELKNVIMNDGEAPLKNPRHERGWRGSEGWSQAKRIREDSSIGGQFDALMKGSAMSREAT